MAVVRIAPWLFAVVAGEHSSKTFRNRLPRAVQPSSSGHREPTQKALRSVRARGPPTPRSGRTSRSRGARRSEGLGHERLLTVGRGGSCGADTASSAKPLVQRDADGRSNVSASRSPSARSRTTRRALRRPPAAHRSRRQDVRKTSAARTSGAPISVFCSRASRETRVIATERVERPGRETLPCHCPSARCGRGRAAG